MPRERAQLGEVIGHRAIGDEHRGVVDVLPVGEKLFGRPPRRTQSSTKRGGRLGLSRFLARLCRALVSQFVARETEMAWIGAGAVIDRTCARWAAAVVSLRHDDRNRTGYADDLSARADSGAVSVVRQLLSIERGTRRRAGCKYTSPLFARAPL